MEDTKSLIKKCSKLPISIIIVGVGSANFDAMQELDDNAEVADKRDLV